GLVSNVAKITSELELRTDQFGAFVRGSAFYDFEVMGDGNDRTDLTRDAKNLVGRRVDLLDAYLWGNFDLGPMPLQVRVGEQVVSWGESTFIQGGINTINPIDVSAIRVPGAELREALNPEGMVWASLGLTENFSLEGLYLYDWEETVIDPTGSYWSTNDFAGDGGKKVMLGFGEAPDGGNASVADTFLAVPRGDTTYANDQGQFGVALRVFAPGLNDTEFGFYYLRYNSRLPVISATTGTAAGVGAAGLIAGVAPTIIGTALVAGVPAAIAAGEAAGVSTAAATAIAGSAAAAAAAAAAAGGDPVAAASAAGGKAATSFATDAYAKTAHYRTEYPEDIQLLGVSLNTLEPWSGIAFQAEVSHRLDVPLQVDDLELLFATLGGLNVGLAQGNQLGNYYMQLDQDIDGYIERDVTQVQATATKIFGPGFGADQTVLLGEVGWTHVHNMPDKDELRMEGPATYISGNQDLAYAHGIGADRYEPASAFADADSWGYRAVLKMDFNNAIGAVALSPRVAWSHDVSGITPGPGGNFIEGRKAVTLGLGSSYQNAWTTDLSYTSFFGAGRYNLLNDRDFVAFNIKYSF
ncbi:MAG TPA: DUF1302 domain-containing protein, partial [Deferrisomatales bacterium]|nr:DUF1302 domain-containing protein [Deferrisomatales bacterium]